MKILKFVLCTAAGKPNELLITALVRAVKKLYGNTAGMFYLPQT